MDFPLSLGEPVTAAEAQVRRPTVPLAFTRESGLAQLEWTLEPAEEDTLRLEAWDVTSE